MPGEAQHQDIRIVLPRDLDPEYLATRARDSGSLSFQEGETMGTTWRLHFLCPPHLGDRQVEHWIQGELDLVVRQMSHYAEDSELTRFNQSPAGEWQEISPEFYTVLRRALDIARITGGRYDPTLGQFSRRNGFGPALFGGDDNSRPPGWSALELDEVRRAARHSGNCFLDLSSIAKGYALDRVGERLEREQIFNYLFEIGGEFRGNGIKPGGQPWWVDLDPLRGRPSSLPTTRVALCGLSLATSGTAVQSFIEGGSLRHHLIDSHTGVSVQSSLRAVSVLASTCLEADAWATALFLMGAEKGSALASEMKIAASFVSEEGETFREFCSPAFECLLED